MTSLKWAGIVREVLPYQLRGKLNIIVNSDTYLIQYTATFIERDEPRRSWTFPLRRVAPEQFELNEIDLARLCVEV